METIISYDLIETTKGKPMGLSAAQARLVTITARKSDCEFLSMTLSHQKIALSRDMENISTNYQNALNQTKLVYDYYGSGTSQMDLNYGLLMTPSVYNDYYPKLVTDPKNRVVLNASYAAAARAAGIPAEGLLGTPSSDIRNKFIEALAVENVITPGKAVSIQSVPYGNSIGLGDTVSVSSSTTELTYEELITLIKANSMNTASFGLTFGTTEDKSGVMESPERLIVFDENGTRQEFVNQNSSPSISLADLLNDNAQYVLGMESGKAERTPIMEAAYLQEKIIGSSENSPSFLNWLTKSFTSILGGTTQNDLALQYAYNAVYDLIYPNDTIQDAAKYINDNWDNWGQLTDKKYKVRPKCGAESNDRGLTFGEMMQEIGGLWDTREIHKGYDKCLEKPSCNYIGFAFTAENLGHGREKKDTSEVAINLNNIVDVFLTAFVEYSKGVDETNYSYGVGKVSDSVLYDPTKDDFKFTMVSDTSVDNGDANLEASFYDTMFNIICTQGWVENDQVDDSSYMQEMMKSGKFWISTISDDGYYYQGNYSTDSYISEVADNEAIAKAEAQYNTEKTKIQNKEETIDMKMKNLDTEISSLTTEYDTTKGIITKAIEKSFKRYDA